MSEENEGEEEKQKDESSGSEEFDFYFPFTKPLVLDLPTEEDRALASAWVQKLEVEPETDEDKKERLNYLKLLLFTLQRGRLSGIFKRQPPSGPLEPFPQGFSIFDMANWMLEQDDTPICGGGDGGHLPYTIEMSNDLREFIASQEIPNFGVQMYYAWSSDEVIDKWTFFDEEKFPQYILDKIKQLRETKSSEKISIVKNSCYVKKKGCSLPIPDKCSQKKVKSPQEIERSQGRSFQAYMGLVGRLGNFNDKCDDDPKKFQRQEQRKGKVSRRSDQKKCPGSRGEAEEDEEFDNNAISMGRMDALNRPCLCPYTLSQLPYSNYTPKGEPLQSNCEDQPISEIKFNAAPDPCISQWVTPAHRSPPPRRLRDQCLDNEMPQPGFSQQRNVSPRPRSTSPNPANLECPTDGDNFGEFQNVGMCSCSSPPCFCPCPRMSQKMSAQKGPLSGRDGGSPNLNRTFNKSSEQGQCFNENRTTGTHFTSFASSESSSPRRPDTVGGRTNTGPAVGPEVIHCYDNQNPDPAITKRLDNDADWIPTIGGGNKYMNTDLKLALGRNQLISAAQQNKYKVTSRRELFGGQQQSSVSPVHNVSCPQASGMTKGSPPLESHPLCEHSPPEEPHGPCPSNQPGVYPQQNYLECGGIQNNSAPPQTYCGFHESYRRQITDTYKKPGPQPTARQKGASAYYPTSTFAVKNDSGRLANMANVLQGIKQKTESHREKCASSRSPVNDMHSETEVCPSAQDLEPSTNLRLNRGYLGLPYEECPQPSSPYPGHYTNRLENYQQNECDFECEEEECDSTESLEACPQEASPQGVHYRAPANVPPKECKHQRTSPERTLRPEGDASSSPREFKNCDRTLPPQCKYSSRVCTSEESPECFNAYQENDMQDCYLPMSPQSMAGNRYFNESLKARSGGGIIQPMTSTPLKNYKRNFKDQGTDECSPIRSPPSRCT